MYREKHNFLLLASASFSDCKTEKLVVLTKYHYWVCPPFFYLPFYICPDLARRRPSHSMTRSTRAVSSQRT